MKFAAALSPPLPLDTTTITTTTLSSSTRRLPSRPCLTLSSSPTWSPPSTPLSPLRPETIRPPPLPRPLPSRTSRMLLPLESLRDSMMDNHLLRSLERLRLLRVCSHRSTIWREDLVSCSPLSQFLRTPSRPSRRSSMSEEWERNEQTFVLLTQNITITNEDSKSYLSLPNTTMNEQIL